MSPDVLAVLVNDRRRAVLADYAGARRFRLRHRLARVVLAFALVAEALSGILDDEANTITA